jgi:hypothetical protein
MSEDCCQPRSPNLLGRMCSIRFLYLFGGKDNIVSKNNITKEDHFNHWRIGIYKYNKIRLYLGVVVSFFEAYAKVLLPPDIT